MFIGSHMSIMVDPSVPKCHVLVRTINQPCKTKHKLLLFSIITGNLIAIEALIG
jgi:hypothetical protein